MATDQHVDRPGDPPPLTEIPGISRAHVAGMEATDADAAWVIGGMHHVVLRTIGRRSGNEHKVALPYWIDPDGVRVVIASFAGAEHHPAWFHNIADRAANPEVLVRTQQGSYWSVPDVLESGPDRDRVWAGLLEDRVWYDEYQARTERTIPLVRLPETRPA